MNDIFEKVAVAVIVFLMLFIVVGLPFLLYQQAVHGADIWNQCHPSVQITTKQAFFAKPEISVCETGVLEQNKQPQMDSL